MIYFWKLPKQLLLHLNLLSYYLQYVNFQEFTLLELNIYLNNCILKVLFHLHLNLKLLKFYFIKDVPQF